MRVRILVDSSKHPPPVRIGVTGPTVKDRNWATLVRSAGYTFVRLCRRGGTRNPCLEEFWELRRRWWWWFAPRSLIGRNNQPSKSDNDLFLSFKLRALSVYTWARKGLISCCLSGGFILAHTCEYEDSIATEIIACRFTIIPRAIVAKWILIQHTRKILEI